MIRLVRFEQQNGSGRSLLSWGVATDEGVYDLGQGEQKVASSILDAVQDWDSVGRLVKAALTTAPLVQGPLRLLSPVPEGGKIVCIGLNYRDHAIESGMPIPGEPVVFNKLAGTLCGPEDVVPIPACSQQVDYEAELVIVVGKRAWQVTEDNAESHIFGYTCGHDVSARDWQIGRPGGQWLLGKSFPNFAPIGPAVIPREFIPEATNLAVSLRINGEVMQNSSTRQLIFNPSQLISYLSQCCVLEPGDVIFTGTPPGVGMARKPPRFLQSGDVCEVEIEGIGVLRNRFE